LIIHQLYVDQLTTKLLILHSLHYNQFSLLKSNLIYESSIQYTCVNTITTQGMLFQRQLEQSPWETKNTEVENILNEYEIWEKNKEMMKQWCATLREQHQQDATPIDSNIGKLPSIIH